jgi:pyruvate dehydrogenase E2 component (dihydrolipoamide acetyltransferase)
MISEILMPQGGQDLTTGRIVRWLKKEGEPVKAGEVICEVETEKAVFEVSAPQDGYLLKIITREDEEVEILSVIGLVGEKGDQVTDGTDSSGDIEKKGLSTNETADIAPPPVKEIVQRQPRLVISPKARKLAKDHDIPLDSLMSMRADSKISSFDVLRVVERRSGSFLAKVRSVQPDKMRKTIARRLAESWRSAPHIFVTVEVDMTGIVLSRQQTQEKKASINDYVIYACAQAIKKLPDTNASFQDEDTINYWNDVNIGIAVSTDGGLIVPVIEDADRLTIEQITERSKEIAEKARAGKQVFTKPSRFTISNLGMHNVESFTAVINPPEAAILAVSSIMRKPVVDELGGIIVREKMKMTLSLDHRVGDGVLAAQFLNEVKEILEDGFSLKG